MDYYCPTLKDYPYMATDTGTVVKDILYRVIKEELAKAGVDNSPKIAAKILLAYDKRTRS